MREIVVISGKGGTGKTSVCASLAHLAQNKVVCDLDVDAPDMHILLDPQVHTREAFVSGNEAVIDREDRKSTRLNSSQTCALPIFPVDDGFV